MVERDIINRPWPISRYRVRGKMILQLFLAFFLTSSFLLPSQEEDQEYEIKAAFIYKFTNYIDWDSLIPGDEFVIGIVGPSPVRDQLAVIARTKTVRDKKIIVRQFNKPEDINGPCHILFISRNISSPLDYILSRLSGKGTLTISEKRGYAKDGTDINFIEVDNKLKFEANPKNINASGLKASSQLLKLAIIVD